MRSALIAATAFALMVGSSQQLAAADNTTAASVAPVATMTSYATQDAQPPQGNVKVDVDLDRGDGTTWYANPVWIAIGILGVVILGLVIGMAARGSGGNGSTIVK